MQPRAARELDILEAIGEGRPLTQRALAQRLGVALGLTNLYLKRLAQKGYVKIADFPRKPAARKRLRYLLTARGIAEKTRLSYEHAAYSLRLYRRTRQTLREALGQLPGSGVERVALYGTGEAAELAYLTLREFGLEPGGVFAREPGGHFLGLPVRPLHELDPAGFDAVILASFKRSEEELTELIRAGVPAPKIVALRRLAAGAARDGGAT